MKNVPIANIRRKLEVLLGNATVDMDEKKKALKPNAARGKAVAVPRWLGQLRAAVGSQRSPNSREKVSQVLMEPANAAQPPAPVKNDAKHSHGMATDPAPSL